MLHASIVKMVEQKHLDKSQSWWAHYNNNSACTAGVEPNKILLRHLENVPTTLNFKSIDDYRT